MYKDLRTETKIEGSYFNLDCPSKSIKNKNYYMSLDQTCQISNTNEINIAIFDEKDHKPSIILIFNLQHKMQLSKDKSRF